TTRGDAAVGGVESAAGGGDSPTVLGGVSPWGRGSRTAAAPPEISRRRDHHLDDARLLFGVRLMPGSSARLASRRSRGDGGAPASGRSTSDSSTLSARGLAPSRHYDL